MRYVCSQQEVMYDDFFHAARFAVAAVADASGLVTFSLEVTYDEGLLDVAQGDSLIWKIFMPTWRAGRSTCRFTS